MLRKLLKGLLWLVVLLAAAGFLFVWQVLGVNPLEGGQDHLYELVSNDVDFYLRWPGTAVLREPAAERLADEQGFDWVANAKADLADLTFQIAREANPQIPLGLVEVDFDRDFLGKEMALAGTIRGDYGRPRLDNFIALTRVAGYGKFVSALARDFVRERVPMGDRISVVKGSYFRLQLDDEQLRMLSNIRSGRGREDPNALWFGRIRDVLLVSDEPAWIEAAILGGRETLPADVYFKDEFARQSTRRSDLELFIRPGLAQSFMYHHARPEYAGPLLAVSRFIPVPMIGDVTVQVRPEEQGLALKFANNPTAEGYSKVTKQFLVKLYEGEKADLRYDLTENGIGRLLPRKRVAGALFVHADADALVSLMMDALSDADRQNLDDVARQSTNGRGRAYRSYEELLQEIAQDLGDTHMVVIHRPSAFETADFSAMVDPPGTWPLQPKAQPSFSLVSRIADNTAPEKLVDKITQNLRYFGFKPPEDEQGRPQPIDHPSGKFKVVDLLAASADWELIRPAYGVVQEGGRYFVFSSSVEGMEAIFEAAADPQARLIEDPAVAASSQHLPAQGTLAVLMRGATVRDLLRDRVRIEAEFALRPTDRAKEWRERFRQQGTTDEDQLDELVAAEKDKFRAAEYPRFRDDYRRRVAPVAAVDTAVLGAALGVGPVKQVRGQGYVFLGAGSGPE